MRIELKCQGCAEEWIDAIRQNLCYRIAKASQTSASGTVGLKATVEVESRKKLRPYNTEKYKQGWQKRE